MLEIRNYTIGSLKDLDLLPRMNTVQICMSNSYPSYVNPLKEIEPYRAVLDEKGTDVIYHASLVYTIGRYSYFNEQTRRLIVDQTYELMAYNNSHFVGVVHHANWPIAKEVMRNRDKVDSHYEGNLWDRQRITDALMEGDPLEHSICEFYKDLKAKFEWTMHKGYPVNKVYLENCAQSGSCGECTVAYLADIIMRHEFYDLFGLCVDTLHEFSNSGLDYCDLDTYDSIPAEIDVIYHLNCVPEGIVECCHKDKHSSTDIFECSYRSVDSYKNIINELNYYHVPWVREVSQETMRREILKLNQYNIEQTEKNEQQVD